MCAMFLWVLVGCTIWVGDVCAGTRWSVTDRDTPFGPDVDCRMRHLTAEYADRVQRDAGTVFASRPDLIHDALELGTICPNATRPPTPTLVPWWASLPAASAGYFVDFAKGKDTASGTEVHPLKTVGRALELVGEDSTPSRDRVVTLRRGVHYLERTLELTPAHDNLVITPFCRGDGTPCEQVWLSGGVVLHDLQWTAHDTTRGRNIWKSSLTRVPVAAVRMASGPQASLFRLEDLDGKTELDRARWPNRRPQDGTIDRPSLLDVATSSAEWLQSAVVATAAPKRVETPSVSQSVTTEFNHWISGVGGACTRFDPPAAWICNPNCTGGGAAWDAPGPFFPTGLALGADIGHLFPNATRWTSKDVSQAVLTTWTNGWYTSHFDLASFTNATVVFGPRGGVQGGRGWHFDGSLPGPPKICTGNVRGSDCGPIKIEGILAELDVANEFWIDPKNSTLYFFNNATPGTAPRSTFVAPVLQVLVQMRGVYNGSAAATAPHRPLKNITLRGLNFRDGARTHLEPHGIPSGGDWAMQRTAAVFLEGTDGVVIEGCQFKYLGGIGLMLSGYNRRHVVNASQFSYLGGTAVAAWGFTSSIDPSVPAGVGIDGTAGNFPRGTQMIGCTCHEIGTVEKQSSCYFGAKTAETTVQGCSFFNGPRAMINLNDMLGGGTVISRNVIFNSCRESGDHGAINTWSRTPYLTTVRTGEPSLQPKAVNISSNLIISNYNSFAGVDNDDGSSWFDIGHNVFYMNEGLKSDYHGHDKVYHDNLNIGAGVCCFQFGFISGQDACRGGPCPGGGDMAGRNEFYEVGHTDHCIRNSCVQRPGGSWIHGAYAILWGCNGSLPGCAPPGRAIMSTSGNRVFRESNRSCPSDSGCDVACGMGDNVTLLSMVDFESRCGENAERSTVHPIPSAAEIDLMARRVLDL